MPNDLKQPDALGPVALFGAGGFIGRHLLRRLEDLGVEVIVPIAPDGTRVNITGPVSDLVAAIGSARVVVNAAGTAHVHSSDPSGFWPANATGAGRVAEAVAATPSVRRLVHVSSVAVGGGGLPPAVADYDPFTAYGASKAAGELAVAAALKGEVADLVVVRPAGVGGTDSPGSWGKIRRLVESGKRVPVPDNDVRHDVVEIEEVVDFLVDAVVGRVDAGMYALAGPGPVTLAEYAERVASLVGTRARVVRVPVWLLRTAASSGSVLQRAARPGQRMEQLAHTLTKQRPLVSRSVRPLPVQDDLTP